MVGFGGVTGLVVILLPPNLGHLTPAHKILELEVTWLIAVDDVFYYLWGDEVQAEEFANIRYVEFFFT